MKEEQGTLNIRCNICEMTVFGIRLVRMAYNVAFDDTLIRNLAAHISGKKHSGKISNKEWILVEERDISLEKKNHGAGEEQEESLQLPEPVAAVEVI